jgi:hypothetical protein
MLTEWVTKFMEQYRPYGVYIIWPVNNFTVINAPGQYTPLLNLRSLISGLTPFGWLRSVTLTPTYAIISYGNMIFNLHLFDLCPPFQKHN